MRSGRALRVVVFFTFVGCGRSPSHVHDVHDRVSIESAASHPAVVRVFPGERLSPNAPDIACLVDVHQARFPPPGQAEEDVCSAIVGAACHRANWGEDTLDPRYTDTSDSFRLTWRRAFDPTVTVRVVRSGEGWILVAKALERPTYEESAAPGTERVAELVIRRMNESTWTRFSTSLDRTDYWHLPQTLARDAYGRDGSSWILEARIGGKYKRVERWIGNELLVPSLILLRASGIGIDGAVY